MLTKKIVIQELEKLTIYYHQTKRSKAEIEILAEMWVEDMANLTDERFLNAVKAHRQSSEYFPTGKNIIENAGKWQPGDPFNRHPAF